MIIRPRISLAVAPPRPTDCCCFCLQGSGLYVYTAPAPLGPWTAQAEPVADVACESAPPPPPPPASNPFCGYLSQPGEVDVTLECAVGVIESLVS